jgi:hypothetical protein
MQSLRFFSFSCLLFLAAISISAQDLDQLLTQATGNETEYTTATFKSTRIISGHSIERMPEGQLDFRISHKFGELNTGAYNLWGLDQAMMHLSLEYGIKNWVMVGVGRGTYEKAYDGFLKFTVLRQSKGQKNMPVSVSLLSTAAINTEIKTANYPFWSRVSYVYQLLVARKFNEKFSLEINPTIVHRNIVDTEVDPNDLVSFGAGFRYKLSRHVTFNAEYYYVIPPLNDNRSGPKTYNPLSVGFDIETGGHVFQLFLTNSQAMIEKGFIADTKGNWADGGVHFGFNVSRVFTLKKNH